ncbi:MAG: CDP-glucose 4,6-dehydratase [Steroidobacteraceae bacterium]
MSIDREQWRGRSVLLTGHTGFKGGWLALWLADLGANVHGYALDQCGKSNLFEAANVKSSLASDTRADVCDLTRLRAALVDLEPEVVFHLAAQSLVRESYRDPLRTVATNVLGTANILEAVRATDSVRAVVVVTTDKVYENRDWPHPYRESDPLGGRDPYSASKAAAELIAASYRSSFFAGGEAHAAHIATARAGNVIGGGDWAVDRLVPDCIRAFADNTPVSLRYPDAVRPWQHVLEPLSGYLMLAERLFQATDEQFSCAWNFGPDVGSEASVLAVAQAVAGLWGDRAAVRHLDGRTHPHEAALLGLDNSRARTALGWRPKWSLAQALHFTVEWYRQWAGGADLRDVTLRQIQVYGEAGAV